MKRYLIGALFLISCISLLGQTTGSFQEIIAFEESDYSFTRTLYYYVPADYDPSVSYKLVVGFRGGPHSNAGEFRDQLTFLSDSIQAIIVCPENIDHFWNEEQLTKQLFQYTVQEVVDSYNIDLEYIYLTGLSFGGRHAVIVSMDTDDGPQASLRGVIPFAAGSESHLQPNYSDAVNFPPSCVCIGLADSQTFIDVANSLHTDIVDNSGQSFLNEIPSVGHTTDFPTFPNEMMECLDFIENTYNPSSVTERDKNLNLVRIYPNPTAHYFEIDFDQTLNPVEIGVLDQYGKNVLEVNSLVNKIDISHLSSGIYTVFVDTGKSIVYKKISIYR